MKYPESIDEVTVKHLQYPFTPEEFVKQIAPDKIQSYFIQPLYQEMLLNRCEKGVAFSHTQKDVVKFIIWCIQSKFIKLVAGLLIFGASTAYTINLFYDIPLESFPFWLKFVLAVLTSISGAIMIIFSLGKTIFPYLNKLWHAEFIYSEIRAKYVEKNLDVIISSRRGPVKLAKIIYEDYDEFGDQERNSSEGVQLMNKIKLIEGDDSLGYNVEVLFLNDRIRAKLFDGDYHHWALVAFWAFHEIIPGGGDSWSRKKYYEDFAKVCFATHLYEYVKTHLGIESQTNHDFIETYSNENGEFSPDKVEQLFAEIRSESQIATPIRKILSEINKKASKS
tara:strand:+ start:1548 stop:2555 length:1008 start_codon:yes stop_codon:yes gene_type:complete